MKKFFEWLKTSENVSEYDAFRIENIFAFGLNNLSIGHLVEDHLYTMFLFFDEQEIIIDVDYNKDLKFRCNLHQTQNKEYSIRSTQFYVKRHDAMVAGILLGFEILKNIELNQS